MKIEIIYIFGEPGSGKTFLSDQLEKEFLSNPGTDSVPVNDSNLEEDISLLNQFKYTLLVIQSNGITKDYFRAFKKFLENKEFNRKVIVQSEFEPDLEIKRLCQVYETGYPTFAWVTQIAEDLWEAKAVNIDKVARALYKIQACELVRNYRSGTDGVIYGEGI